MPLAYGLLPGKTQGHYEALLAELASFDVEPESVMSDYEKALINAIKVTWPTTTKRGCYFHHKQAPWRNLASHNLVPEYRVENSPVRMFFQMMGASLHTPRRRLRNLAGAKNLPFLPRWSPLQITTSGHGLAQTLPLPSSPHGCGISTTTYWPAFLDLLTSLMDGTTVFGVSWAAVILPFGASSMSSRRSKI